MRQSFEESAFGGFFFCVQDAPPENMKRMGFLFYDSE